MRARVGKSVVDFMMLKDGKWGGWGEVGVGGTHDDPETRWPAVSGGGEWKGADSCNKIANTFNKPIRPT
jgi:hypothetical protein